MKADGTPYSHLNRTENLGQKLRSKPEALNTFDMIFVLFRLAVFFRPQSDAVL